MRNASSLVTALTIVLFFGSYLWAAPIEGINRTIILIDGTPYLVDMDEQGQEIDKIVPIPSYFISSDSHDLIVDRESREYEEELPNIKSRLLVFTEDVALLDNVMVDHIRDLARLYAKGYIESVHISAAHQTSYGDEALAAHRINVIYQMLRDFGVKNNDITADIKRYKSDLPNVYIRLNIG